MPRLKRGMTTARLSIDAQVSAHDPKPSPPQGCRRLSKRALDGYLPIMTTVSIKDAENRLAELAQLVEKGETIVVTRNGKPVFDLVPHQTKGGLSLEAGEEFLRTRSVKEIFPCMADDFDEPLPQDVLLRPLP
jgi:prevent-host-death family protein